MTDTWRKGRGKGLLGGSPPVDEPEERPGQTDAPPDADAQRQALQVLNLAQRTAEEHVASAHRQAEKILADSRAAAEQIVRDAQAHANDLQREADKVLSAARASAEHLAREARAHADKAQRDAEKVVSDARVRAAEIAQIAQAGADQLNHQAQLRYDDVVGNLATRREGLQRQIEALEQFDQDYRARLTAFMQAQLRALWVDEPQANADIEQPGLVPGTVPVPAQTGR